MEFSDLLNQLPNFAGLIICIYVLVRMNHEKSALITYLIEVIVKKTNCDDDNND